MSTITINLGKRSYPIYIKRGSIVNKGIQSANIVTDTNVARIYKNLLKIEEVYVVKAGEKSKSYRTYINLARKLEDTEEATALGGGVIGDLTGFVASTLKRGIPLDQIPTTLVAMVDSSIGGKNGINLDYRKNYLGTIDQPRSVIIDPDFLKTLPKVEISNGVAEIIKYGVLADSALLERMQKKLSIKDEDLEEIIARCINIKKYFVEKDEKDKNVRHALNFGHTIGHAIELLYNLPHGQAISIGMVYELALSGFNKNMTKLITALEANNLPTQLPFGANIDRIIELMKTDKKGELTFSYDEISHSTTETEEDVRNILKTEIKKEETRDPVPF